MPNLFAYAMLLVWPLVAVALFRKRPRASALVWTLLAGYLLLPSATSIDLPLLPPLDRDNGPVLAAFALCLAGVGLKRSRRVGTASAAAPLKDDERPGWLPRSKLARLLILMLALGPLATTYLNPEPLIYGPRVLKGMALYDGASLVMQQIITILPLLLGRKLLSDPAGVRTLMAAMVAAALVYTIPMLVEIRLSPQIHSWVYGFFPHDFIQTKRFDGFRPQVFLLHGLKLALYMSMTFLVALALIRVLKSPAPGERKPRALGGWKLSAAWLGIMLVLSKSVGALASALVMLPLVLLAGRRMQIGAAVIVAAVTLLYPAVRSLDLVPTDTLVSMANQISPNRAQSLEFRFDNEDLLLAKADERPVFGWGSWARNRVFHETKGWDQAITDGLWVITFGVYGWFGYIAQFGLLTLPIFALFRQRRHPDLSLETTTLCLVLCVNYLDLLLNSGMTPLTWLMAGAILGRAEALAANPVSAKQQAAAPARNANALRRPSATRPGHPAPQRPGPRGPEPQTPVSPRPSAPRPDPGRSGPMRPGIGGRPETSSDRFPR